jgi:hypothetical protein
MTTTSVDTCACVTLLAVMYSVVHINDQAAPAWRDCACRTPLQAERVLVRASIDTCAAVARDILSLLVMYFWRLRNGSA